LDTLHGTEVLVFLFPVTSNHHQIDLFEWRVSGFCDGPEV